MSGNVQNVLGADRTSQVVFLALLRAARGDCQCEVCQLLRKLIDSLTQQALEEI